MRTRYYINPDQPGATCIVGTNNEDAHYVPETLSEEWREATLRESIPLRLRHPRFTYVDAAVAFAIWTAAMLVVLALRP